MQTPDEKPLDFLNDDNDTFNDTCESESDTADDVKEQLPIQGQRKKSTKTGDCKKTRYHLLDTLRGIMIIGVVIYHIFVDLAAFDHAPAFFESGAVWISVIADLGRVLFILLAGICCRLSHNNLRRSFFCIGGAVIISLVTYFYLPDAFIYCGILHLLGFCILIYAIFERIFPVKHTQTGELADKKPFFTAGNIFAVLAFAALAVCSVLTWNLHSTNTILGMSVNSVFSKSLIAYLIGFSGFKPASADYFPLLPWVFVFFAGTALGVLFRNKSVPRFFTANLCSPLSFIGRHTLVIYLAHQPIVYFIMTLIFAK